MSSNIEYQRFRHGEGCLEEGCRARKFYIEDGKKFCQRGHEQAVCLASKECLSFSNHNRVSHKPSKTKMIGMHKARSLVRSEKKKNV